MATTLYTADLVVPVVSPPIADGAVLVCDGRIAGVGARSEIEAQTGADTERVAFGASILMPPLVNAHAHLELTDFPLWRSRCDESAEPGDFAEWILQVIRVKRSLQTDDYAASLRSGLQQSLRYGTGVLVDIVSHADLGPIYADSPLLGRVDCELIGRDPAAMTPLLKRARAWLKGREEGSLARGLSPHAPYTVAPDILEAIVALAETELAPLSIHVAETRAEVELLMRSHGALAEKLYPVVDWQPAEPPYGLDPIAYLDRAGALRPSTLLVHGVYLHADAIGRIGRIGSSVVLCPRSNRRLGSDPAPVDQYLCRGINLALGTDSLASNDSLSLWAEMQAVQELYGSLLSAAETVAMATCNGAAALGLGSEVGSLQPGHGEHFLVLRPPQVPALHDLAAFLCSADRQDEVCHLYLHGKDVLPHA